MVQISLITATYNSGETLQRCLKSVSHQNPKPEHLIIDGCSKDQTLKTARSYFGHALQVYSAPDNGLYDAMNKGIKLASGDVIGILNADDFYASSHVLEKVVGVFNNPDVDACYGDLHYVAENNTDKLVRRWKAGSYSLDKFYNGWMPPHPTFFVRRSVYERYGLFNLDLGSAADYELMLRFLVKYRIRAAYIPEVLVKMQTGGVSNASLKNRLLANRMDRKAWEVNDLKPYPWTLWLKPLRKVGQWIIR